MVIGSEIASNHVGRATINPTSNGRTWDVSLGEDVSISGRADCFLDSVVVGPSRVDSFHLERIGRRMRDHGGAITYPDGTAQRIEAMINRLDEFTPRSEEENRQLQEALAELEEMFPPADESRPN
jgi:hypothetical protein